MLSGVWGLPRRNRGRIRCTGSHGRRGQNRSLLRQWPFAPDVLATIDYRPHLDLGIADAHCPARLCTSFRKKIRQSCQCQPFRTLSQSTKGIASVECCLILDKASTAENSSRTLPIHFLMIISSQRLAHPVSGHTCHGALGRGCLRDLRGRSHLIGTPDFESSCRSRSQRPQRAGFQGPCGEP